MSLIYCINSGKKYTAPPKPDRFSFSPPEPTSLEEVKEEDEDAEQTEQKEITDKTEKTAQKDSLPSLNKPHCNIKLKLLPLGTVEQLPRKRNLLKYFDLIFFSTAQVSYFTPEITALLKDDANVVVENIKFIAPLTKEQEAAFIPKIKDLATKAKCELLGTNDVLNNNFHLSYHRTE